MSDLGSDDDLADLYENAPCGYVSLAPDARIVRLNATLANWVGSYGQQLRGKPFHALLSFGGRIAFETHIAPILRLQGFLEEVALDLLHADGTRVPVIANAREKRTPDGALLVTRLTVFKAVERRKFERGLMAARDQASADAAAEHEISLLREQFIAVLGHDLKNPLAALGAGIHMIGKRESLSERGKFLIGEMGASLSRASGLIDNVLDFARGRLGEGLVLAPDDKEPLAPVLEQVVNEIRAIAPDREIETDFAIDRPINCDRARIAQLASNLIANAVTHGAKDRPVSVKATIETGMFVFSVANSGDPIPPAAHEQLFQPFFRGNHRESQQGLGLGLFIVNEIAKAHGGAMSVTSDEDETRFVFSMPLETSSP